MSTFWEESKLQVGLTFENPFEVAFPQKYRPHALNKFQTAQDEVTHISANLFEHPMVDLQSIFLDFRLSGLVSTHHIVPIHNFVGECQKDIEALDTKIQDTISAISRLSRELTLASARMVQRVSQIKLCEYLLSSPKYSLLPQDVLGEIFLACLATNVKLRPEPNCAPLQVASVCHRWRSIALSMPKLWNTLYIRLPQHIPLAKTWAGRCYVPSLTIYIEGNPVQQAPLEKFLHSLTGPNFSPRIIDLGTMKQTKKSLRLILMDFILKRDHPSLEELVLQDWVEPLSSLPMASPSLRRLYLRTPPETWQTSPPPSQLTVLWLTSSMHCDTFVTFLLNCPNLESLYVSLNEEGFLLGAEHQVNRDVTLPRLRYLGLWDEYEGSAPPENLLQGIRFPSLRVFEYCLTKRSPLGSSPWLGIIQILEPVLRLTLQFHACLPAPDTIIHLLEHATSVTELMVSTNSRFMPDLVTTLTSFPSRSTSQDRALGLRSLQTLYLNITYREDLKEWLSLEGQIIEFGSAWTASISSEPAARLNLTELVIEHFYNNPIEEEHRNETWKSLEVKNLLQSACPHLHVRIVCSENCSCLGDDPDSFEMFPLPSQDAYSHIELEDDGSWTERRRPRHRVMG